MNGAALPITSLVGYWLAIFITIAILSFLFDDNPFYKLAEHLFVGVSVGVVTVYQYQYVVKPNLVDRLLSPALGAGRALYLVPLALVVMLFLKLSPRFAAWGRLPIAFIIGIYAGQNIPAYANANLVSQIAETFAAIGAARDGGLAEQAGAFVLVTGFIASLVYFYFSAEHRGVQGVVARVGVLVLMVGFGASFGYTVQGRIALAIGRAMDVLGLDKPAPVAAQIHGGGVAVAAIIFVGVGIWWTRRRTTHAVPPGAPPPGAPPPAPPMGSPPEPPAVSQSVPSVQGPAR